MEDQYAYLFEAKGIQSYILDSGRLIDLTGGSDLIASLCSSDGKTDLLAKVLVAAEVSGLEESRRAGAAFCLHGDKESLDRVRALWRLTVALSRPGLPFADIDPVRHGENFGKTLEAAYGAQPGVRNNTQAFLLPAGHAAAAFIPRTGAVATTIDQGGENEPLDAVRGPQRRRGRDIADRPDEDRLANAFLPEDEDAAKAYRFPRHFDTVEATETNPAFPFLGEDRRVGVVHVDLSGLGQVFRTVAENARDAADLRKVANAIEAAIEGAARAASEAILLPAAARPGDKVYATLLGRKKDQKSSATHWIVPARPIVLGGDDITVIVRADLALPFAARLLEEIEIATQAALGKLANGQLPSRLSACAGVAITGSGHPFLAAAHLADGLCATAKVKVKVPLTKDEANDAPDRGFRIYPSALAFAVVTATIDRDYADHLAAEETVPDEGLVLSGGPYLVAGTALKGLKPWAALRDLAAELGRVPGIGKINESLSARFNSKEEALRLYERFTEVLSMSSSSDALKRIDAALAQCVGEVPEGVDRLDAILPVLSDALELVDVGMAVDQISMDGRKL